MNVSLITAREVRAALLLRRELALFDLGTEDAFAKNHPLFASQIDVEHAPVQLAAKLPRKDAPVVLYDRGEGSVEQVAKLLRELGHTHVHELEHGLKGWRDAGFELFQDVNSYSKAFGELVESRRHTPYVPAEQLQQLLEKESDLVVLDARRYDEYHTMSIPSGTSVPGAELVLRARELAPDPRTTIVVNCAGRTRSIIGAQSLINAGLPNRVLALRNGTIGWTLVGQTLEHGQTRSVPKVRKLFATEARERARTVAYRAGVKRIGSLELAQLQDDATRTLYRFDVRTPEEYAAGHLPGFRSAPGGQLVQETDMFAPVRGARIVLSDLATPGEEALGVRADMSASWLAQLGWEVFVLDAAADARETGAAQALPRNDAGRYKRPYEGTDNPKAAMQAYLDWEYGLVAQLARDGSHGFYVI